MYIADRKGTSLYLYMAKLFELRCVNSIAALPQTQHFCYKRDISVGPIRKEIGNLMHICPS